MSAGDRCQLSEVRLERFKAAFKPEAIGLRPFNVVIGRNGSGKSTLIEALQWLDTTIRRDAREACDRYHGIQDLINLRSQTNIPFFRLTLHWTVGSFLRYKVKVEDREGLPFIAEEELASAVGYHLATKDNGERSIVNAGIDFRESDRLAVGLKLGNLDAAFLPIEDFWSRCVFLRLSTTKLSQGSLATRKSFEPLLDEEGENLPALLNELTAEQRTDLVTSIQDVLEGIRGVEVSRAELGRDTRVNYSLLERMPYQGRSGRRQFPIPAWMLSEGTRRITAILALLSRDPAPSLLCIEEVENGLDPWTVRAILRHLESAADRGTQVIVTTHSPWVLDQVPIESIIQVRRIEGDTKYEHFVSRPEIRAFAPSVPAGTRYVREME